MTTFFAPKNYNSVDDMHKDYYVGAVSDSTIDNVDVFGYVSGVAYAVKYEEDTDGSLVANPGDMIGVWSNSKSKLMKAIVFHQTDFTGWEVDTFACMTDYIAVAIVESDQYEDVKDFLEHVFERTNSFDSPWTQNAGVVPIVDKARSTSVGDLAWVDKTMYACKSIGWEKIPYKETKNG